MSRIALLRIIPLPALAISAIAACQPTVPVQTFAYGEEQVAACVATACRTLTLDYAPLSDYSQVAGLGHVTALMLGYTNFSDLTDIATMTQLRELHIGSTPVRDLGGIESLQNLQLLHAQYVQPTSWEPLVALQGLRELAIGHAGMRDFSIVARLPNLQRLYVTALGDETDLSGIGAHRGLRSVHLDSDYLSDLSPLLALPNLREVSIEAFDESRHAGVIAQLRARGVRVTLTEPVIVVC